MPRLGFIIAALALSLCLIGCVSPEDLVQLQTQAEGYRQSLAQEMDELAEIVARLPEDEPARLDAQARLSELHTLDSALAASITRVKATLTEAEQPSDPISQLVGWLAPWLPEPVRTPALLASALLVSLIRGRQLKDGFRSVVKGFDRALKDDEAFSQAFMSNAPTFRATQTPLAQRLVDSMSSR